MAERTGIAWTDHTFNPWMGCLKVSPGCEHCYAETLTRNRMGLRLWGPPSTTPRQRTKGPWSELPRWNAAAARDGVRRKVFCASLADVFEDHPDVAPWRAEALALLERCTALDVQLLTKRPENILAMVPAHWREAWPAHVWIGTTVEDQRRAEERIPHLLAVPAAVRFLSCEPLLEAVDLSEWIAQRGNCRGCGSFDGFHVLCPRCGEDSLISTWGAAQLSRWESGERYENHGPLPCDDGPQVHWIIVGGESGPGARPFDIAWARSIVAQCREAGVPVFVKQLGARAVEKPDCPRDAPLPFRALRLRDRAGADPAEWPEDLRVQQFPEVQRLKAGEEFLDDTATVIRGAGAKP